MTRMLKAILLLCALGTAVPLAGNDQLALRRLSEGLTVKVEGRMNEADRLVADKLEVVEDGGGIEIEGPVAVFDPEASRLVIAVYAIEITPKTAITSDDRPGDLEDIVEGVRVKVKARVWEERRIVARSIRVYENSSDRDIEIKGRIEGIRPNGSAITLVSLNVELSRKTELRIPGATRATDFDEILSRGGLRRDDDEQQMEPLRIGGVYVGGRMGTRAEISRNMDLDEDDRDSEDRFEPGAQVEISAPLGEFNEAYARLDLSRSFYSQGPEDAEGRTSFRVREAFVTIGNFIHPSLALRVGRQRFREKREWLYDERLDAVRLFFVRESFKLEGAVTRTLINPSGSRKDQLHLIARAECRFPGQRYLSAYFIKRNDLSSRDEDPIWYGIQSRGRITRSLEYWLELSQMRGRRENRLLRGFGYDVGASWRMRGLPLEPTISGGYALGSGDADLDDGVDGNFRQTRLNDNSYRFNGLKRYRYYGVLLEPELYNLKILTLDLGLRSGDIWSLNLAYHDYRQHVASKRIGDMTLTRRPRGRNPRLGREFDLILAVRRIRRIDISFLLGLFLPGPAFDGTHPRAFYFSPEIKYYF